jgi:hypothetical protein
LNGNAQCRPRAAGWLSERRGRRSPTKVPPGRCRTLAQLPNRRPPRAGHETFHQQTAARLRRFEGKTTEIPTPRSGGSSVGVTPAAGFSFRFCPSRSPRGSRPEPRGRGWRFAARPKSTPAGRFERSLLVWGQKRSCGHVGCNVRISRKQPIRHRYSITSSARASSVGGISRPSALAVLRLMAKSIFVG